MIKLKLSLHTALNRVQLSIFAADHVKTPAYSAAPVTEIILHVITMNPNTQQFTQKQDNNTMSELNQSPQCKS